jgi:acyl carrier protein
MKTADSIQTTIREYIFRQFPAARERRISDTDSLLDLGIIDSLGVLDVVAYLESEFKITIADDQIEAEDFASIQSLARFVQRRLGCSA